MRWHSSDELIDTELNLGGSIEMVPNPVAVAELAVEKGAVTLLMSISSENNYLSSLTKWQPKSTLNFMQTPLMHLQRR